MVTKTILEGVLESIRLRERFFRLISQSARKEMEKRDLFEEKKSEVKPDSAKKEISSKKMTENSRLVSADKKENEEIKKVPESLEKKQPLDWRGHKFDLEV